MPRGPWKESELRGVRSELDNSQAARAAALRELRRGIRRVRASRFWFQDDAALRSCAGAWPRARGGGGAGRVAAAASGCRTFDEGDGGASARAGDGAATRPARRGAPGQARAAVAASTTRPARAARTTRAATSYVRAVVDELGFPTTMSRRRRTSPRDADQP